MKNFKLLSAVLLTLSAGSLLASDEASEHQRALNTILATKEETYRKQASTVQNVLEKNVNRLKAKLAKHRIVRDLCELDVRNNCTEEYRKAAAEGSLQFCKVPEFHACQSALSKRFLAATKLSTTEVELLHAQTVANNHVLCTSLFESSHNQLKTYHQAS